MHMLRNTCIACWLAHLLTVAPALGQTEAAEVADFYSGNTSYTYDDVRQHYERQGLPIKVCTSEWNPMVRCGGTDVNPEYSGFFTEAFRQTYTLLGLRPNQFEWQCMELLPLLQCNVPL